MSSIKRINNLTVNEVNQRIDADNRRQSRSDRLFNQFFNDFTTTVYTSGDQTVTLPAATGSGRIYGYTNTGTGSVTVSPTGSDTIQGDTSVVFYKATILFRDNSDGEWVII